MVSVPLAVSIGYKIAKLLALLVLEVTMAVVVPVDVAQIELVTTKILPGFCIAAAAAEVTVMLGDIFTFVTTAPAFVKVKTPLVLDIAVGIVPPFACILSAIPEIIFCAVVLAVEFLPLLCSAGTAINTAARIAPAIASTISTSTIVKPLLFNFFCILSGALFLLKVL